MSRAPVKQCAACLGVCHRVTRVCPGCGTTFYPSRAKPKTPKLVLVEEHRDRSERVVDMLAENMRDSGSFARVRVNWKPTEGFHYVRGYKRAEPVNGLSRP